MFGGKEQRRREEGNWEWCRMRDAAEAILVLLGP